MEGDTKEGKVGRGRGGRERERGRKEMGEAVSRKGEIEDKTSSWAAAGAVDRSKGKKQEGGRKGRTQGQKQGKKRRGARFTSLLGPRLHGVRMSNYLLSNSSISFFVATVTTMSSGAKEDVWLIKVPLEVGQAWKSYRAGTTLGILRKDKSKVPQIKTQGKQKRPPFVNYEVGLCDVIRHACLFFFVHKCQMPE
jgi:hypothetical protein